MKIFTYNTVVRQSIEQLLDEVARRGSWFGGGSVAALSTALAAALLEKLSVAQATVIRLRGIRCECLRLVEQDARTFASVIAATRTRRQATFRSRLKAAIDVPCRIVERAQTIQRLAREQAGRIKPQFRSDLQCVSALATSAETAARALINTNLAWLNDPRYRLAIHRRLGSHARPRGR